MDLAKSRKRIWGWMFFDWAQQPYATLGLTFVFAPYFASVAKVYFGTEGLEADAAEAAAQNLWSGAQTISGLFIALSAPFLGAWADATGRKMPWMALFSVITVICAAMLWNLLPDGTGLYLVLFAFWVGFTASESAFNLANALLPSLGDTDDVGAISGNATAFGYWGGVLALIVVLLFFAENDNGVTLIELEPAFGLDPEAREGTRFTGPFIALWFSVFIIPFFLWTKDPPRRSSVRPRIRAVLGDLKLSVRAVWKRSSCRSFLLASMFYRDGLTALYAYGGIYAGFVLEWTIIQIGVFGIVAAISAAILSWAGGLADRRFGPKPVIVLCVTLLILVGLVIVGMTRQSFFGLPLREGSLLPDAIFYVCGAIVGGAGGALYSASRSMMVRHTEADRPAESFGLFALTGKATAFLAPALINVTTRWTGDAQIGYTPIIGLFVLGLILLIWVKPNGDRAE